MSRWFPVAVLALLVVAAAPQLAASDAPPRVRASMAYDADGNRVFDTLDAALAATPAGQPVEVIVVFTGATAAEGVRDVRAAAGPVEPLFTYPSLPGAAFALTKEQVARVASLDAVRQVELDVPGTPELTTSTHYLGARNVWNDLGVTGDIDGNPDVFTPADATIAVLDTGIHAQHLDFTGKLLAWHDTVSGTTVPSDGNGHGTHVSSIAAGRGLADPERKGVAPGASLVLVRISAKTHALAAVQWVIDHRVQYGIDVMTMSFGFGIGADGSDSLAVLFDAAFDAGIVTVKSTGNSGPNHGTMTIPADAHHILATGALEDPGKSGWKLATFSSRGPTTDGRIKPDVSAPGVAISAALRGTTNGYTSLSGTSMAAPHVAGVAALVKAANPALSAQQVRDAITSTALDVSTPGPDNDYGHGIVDPYAAVRLARGMNGTNPVRVPSIASLSGTFGPLPSAWLLQLENTSKPFALTVLTETARPYDLRIYNQQGQLVASVAGGQRHANANVATQPGLHLVVMQGGGSGPFSIDASAPWPLQPPPWHGLGTVLG